MKNTLLTFIIPVRHPDNAENWANLKNRLQETSRSIAAQDAAGWKAMIVANRGADLPSLPEGFEIVWVDFPPNKTYRQGTSDIETFREAVRADKGRRILAGMLAASDSRFFMVVDDDDFIHRQLVSYVAGFPDAYGWDFQKGYIWNDGGRFLYLYSDFSHYCGTSHILRADLLGLPSSLETATEDYIQRMLGSHVFISDIFRDKGTPLVPLPFPGAIYRVGNQESHSQSDTLFRHFFGTRQVLLNPLRLLKRILRLRIKTRTVEKLFFGRL